MINTYVVFAYDNIQVQVAQLTIATTSQLTSKWWVPSKGENGNYNNETVINTASDNKSFSLEAVHEATKTIPVFPSYAHGFTTSEHLSSATASQQVSSTSSENIAESAFVLSAHEVSLQPP